MNFTILPLIVDSNEISKTSNTSKISNVKPIEQEYKFKNLESSCSLSITFGNSEGIARKKLALEYLFNLNIQILCRLELNFPNSVVSLILSESKNRGYFTSLETDNNLGRTALIWDMALDPFLTQSKPSSPLLKY